MKTNSTFFTWLFDGKGWCDLVGRCVFVAGVYWAASVGHTYYKDSGMSKRSSQMVSKLMFWR